MTIRCYPHPVHVIGAPFQVLQASNIRLEDWLVRYLPGYEPRDVPPIEIMANGELLPPDQWPHFIIDAQDDIGIYSRPQGGTLIVAAVVAAVSVVAAFAFRPTVPNQTNQNTQQGSRLLEVSGEANQVKLNDIIPEVAGRQRRYPDYLNAPRRVFEDNHTTQNMRVLVAIGEGEYEIQPEDFYVGDTPFQSLGSAIEWEVFGPGEPVNGNSASFNWYNAPEVGPAVGKSGIPLGSNRDADPSWDGRLTFNHEQITSAPEDVPEGWGVGLVVDIILPQPITVQDGGAGDYDIAIGGFRWMGLEPGDRIQIHLYPDDDLRVNTITPGATINTDELTLDVWTVVGGTPESPIFGWAPVNSLPIGDTTWRITYPSNVSPANTLNFIITDVITNGFVFRGRKNGVNIPDWPGFPNAATSNASVQVSSGDDMGIWSLAFAACPRGEVATRLEWDIFADQGLVERGETSGNLYQIERQVQLRYREVGATAWEEVITRTIRGRTPDQLGWTFNEELPRPMRPEVQVRRTSAESDSVFVSDALQFYGLRSRLPAPQRYSGITTLAINLSGSDQIAAQTDNQINVICTRKLQVMRGPGDWSSEKQPTRDISAWMRYIALSAGYSDADIDQEELWRLHRIWTQRGDTFDWIEGDDSTVKDSLNRVLRVGFSELTVADGKLRPVRDEPRTAIQNVYSAQNMRENLKISMAMPKHDDPDGVDVEYTDQATWTSSTLRCRLSGDAGAHPEQIRAEGITDRDKAYQFGMRHRRIQEYRRISYSFGTEMDGLNSEYLSYDALISDVPGEGQSMICEAVDGTTLHVSEPLEWESGTEYYVGWRRPNGTLAGPYIALPGDDAYSVIMGNAPNGTAPSVPTLDPNLEPPHVFFGPVANWTHRVLMQKITPEGFGSVTIEGVNYDDRVYLSDDASAPEDA